MIYLPCHRCRKEKEVRETKRDALAPLQDSIRIERFKYLLYSKMVTRLGGNTGIWLRDLALATIIGGIPCPKEAHHEKMGFILVPSIQERQNHLFFPGIGSARGPCQGLSSPRFFLTDTSKKHTDLYNRPAFLFYRVKSPKARHESTQWSIRH